MPTRAASLRIRLASPEDILSWSSGEVTRPETLNYRSLRPERGGLFCERIFGPERDWECGCGKLRGLRFKDRTCEKCGVQVAHSRVRRKRMGHIELAEPVVHCWFFRNAPSRLAQLLGMTPSALERIIYYQDAFEGATGAAAIQEMLRRLDLNALAVELRRQLRDNDAKARPSVSRREQLTARLQTVEALRQSGNRPEWMVLRRLPVIPPDLRPIVLLSGGTFATSDLNDLYRRILSRNSRLRRLREMEAPAVILHSEMRMLQQAVDALFDNAGSEHPILGASQRPLKSLTEMLQGKQGRFRENLLGKRVDYSARSVIVVGPALKLHQCGLPRKIALELFQPFIIRRMLATGLAGTVKKARGLIENKDERIWDLLAEVMKGHPVLLNRAPTLHRMGIQAFEPVLCEGNAIRLHPLVCKAFNADFDGDQIAVHLPLSIEAIAEARSLMMPASNIFSPASGQPIISPTQDIVLGCGYLTTADRRLSIVAVRLRIFAGSAEVIHAHEQGKLGLHEAIRVRLPRERRIVREGAQSTIDNKSTIDTTVGRVLFNDVLAQGMAFYDLPMTAAVLGRVVADCHALLGRTATVELLDRLKTLGFRFATRGGLSFALSDLRTPASKDEVIRATRLKVEKVHERYLAGDIGADDRSERIVELWTAARDRITDDLMECMAGGEGEGNGSLNPVLLMARSGARGGKEQLRQLAGMRGLIARPSGEVLETPITSNFREGLSVHEYFSSTHGARKGLADTALKTSEAGHLTRRLVDVAQDVVVSCHDCGSRRGILKAVEDARGRVLLKSGKLIADQTGLKPVRIRSPLTCAAPRGVCQLCYGTDLATGRLVEEGVAVGVIAAQSIGEPGTQLTMRTFHIGGVHNKDDITRGLPRVVELFEAWEPERVAVLAECAGRVRLGRTEERIRGKDVVFVARHGEEVAHILPPGARLAVKTGDAVKRGQALTEGQPAPKELLRLCGAEAVQDYLLREVQAVYRAQNVRLDDRHIEIIVARMLSRVKVLTAGDTELLAGAIVSKQRLSAANAAVKDGQPATAAPMLLGVSRAAVLSDSFISAASFQETTRVLTAAALAGKVDLLEGLKENVIVGRLVPAGTVYHSAV